MTAMENKVCGKEVGVAQGWTISSPTFLEVDSLDSWVARGVAPGMEVGGEERIWFTLSSKTKFVQQHVGSLSYMLKMSIESHRSKP